ncbi:MAG: hypothetical protein CMB99_00200 [Flavobacteriaceae bacterium]|nr:hypothetical protein [Flavobacteriaceae bacterium]
MQIELELREVVADFLAQDLMRFGGVGFVGLLQHGVARHTLAGHIPDGLVSVHRDIHQVAIIPD